MSIILLAGGSGLIGTELHKLLVSNGNTVRVLTRNKKRAQQVDFYYWNPQTNEFDDAAFSNVTAIINLCGAAIANKRWSKKRKQEILRSRVESNTLLQAACKKNNCTLSVFICASGTGYYGNQGSSNLREDAMPSGNYLLTHVCKQWEQSTKPLATIAERTVILRTGIVLSTKDGMLPKLISTSKFGVLTIFGNGTQYYPWIHIDDIVHMYAYALKNTKLHGVFNAVAPNPVTNAEFIYTLKQVLTTPVACIHIPIFFLRFLLGEMAVLLTASTKASSATIEATDFHFIAPTLETALTKLLTYD